MGPSQPNRLPILPVTARQAQSAGAGLGLSIAAAMARLHHAELTYERWNREEWRIFEPLRSGLT